MINLMMVHVWGKRLYGNISVASVCTWKTPTVISILTGVPRQRSWQTLSTLTKMLVSWVVGGIDCMKLKRKNCPSRLKGQYHDTHEGNISSIGSEAWCDRTLYVCTWFFRMIGN